MKLSAFTTLVLTVTLGIFSAAAAAAGDADAGGKLFTKTCGGATASGRVREGVRSSAQWRDRTHCRDHAGLSILGRDEELRRGLEPRKAGRLY